MPRAAAAAVAAAHLKQLASPLSHPFIITSINKPQYNYYYYLASSNDTNTTGAYYKPLGTQAGGRAVGSSTLRVLTATGRRKNGCIK